MSLARVLMPRGGTTAHDPGVCRARWRYMAARAAARLPEWMGMGRASRIDGLCACWWAFVVSATTLEISHGTKDD